MIRLRNAAGDVKAPESDWGFVELCDSDNNPVFVIYKDGPTYKVIGKKDPEAARYAKMFGVRFVEHRELEF